MKVLRCAVAVLTVIVAGCGSVEGTRDKSVTALRSISAERLDSVAVLPIKESAAMDGLSNQIAAALRRSLAKSIPAVKVVDAQTFSASLAQAGLVQSYRQWVSGYEAISIPDAQQLRQFGKAAGAHFFLLVPSVYINREKVEAAATGYSGFVADASNVWRTDLRASAVLIDSSNGSVVWRGTAHAENISSKTRNLDLGVVIFNTRSPEISDSIGQLIQTLADGLSSQIAGR